MMLPGVGEETWLHLPLTYPAICFLPLVSFKLFHPGVGLRISHRMWHRPIVMVSIQEPRHSVLPAVFLFATVSSQWYRCRIFYWQSVGLKSESFLGTATCLFFLLFYKFLPSTLVFLRQTPPAVVDIKTT